MKRTAEEQRILRGNTSAVGFTDSPSEPAADPSDESLGYFHSSANADLRCVVVSGGYSPKPKTIHSRLGMGFVVNLNQFFHRHMSIDLGRGKARVAK